MYPMQRNSGSDGGNPHPRPDDSFDQNRAKRQNKMWQHAIYFKSSILTGARERDNSINNLSTLASLFKEDTPVIFQPDTKIVITTSTNSSPAKPISRSNLIVDLLPRQALELMKDLVDMEMECYNFTAATEESNARSVDELTACLWNENLVARLKTDNDGRIVFIVPNDSGLEEGEIGNECILYIVEAEAIVMAITDKLEAEEEEKDAKERRMMMAAVNRYRLAQKSV